MQGQNERKSRLWDAHLCMCCGYDSYSCLCSSCTRLSPRQLMAVACYCRKGKSSSWWWNPCPCKWLWLNPVGHKVKNKNKQIGTKAGEGFGSRRWRGGGRGSDECEQEILYTCMKLLNTLKNSTHPNRQRDIPAVPARLWTRSCVCRPGPDAMTRSDVSHLYFYKLWK